METHDDIDIDVTPVPDPNVTSGPAAAVDWEDEASPARAESAEQAPGSSFIDGARSTLHVVEDALRRQLEERPYVILASAAGAGVIAGGGTRVLGAAMRAGRKMAFNIALGQLLDFVLPKPPKHE